MSTSLWYLTVWVDDLAGALKFWRDCLNLQVDGPKVEPPDNPVHEIAWVKFGKVELGIMGPVFQTGVAPVVESRPSGSLQLIAVKVDKSEIVEIGQRLTANNIAFRGTIDPSNKGNILVTTNGMKVQIWWS